jgi:hypothetical protein
MRSSRPSARSASRGRVGAGEFDAAQATWLATFLSDPRRRVADATGAAPGRIPKVVLERGLFMASQRQREQYAAHIRKLIAEHGWAIQGVGDTATEPPFSYTVGMTEAGLPELVIVGLSHETGGVILNMLAKQSLAEELVVGRRYDLVNGDRVLTCLIGQVSRANTRRYLLAAGYHYGWHRTKALQAFWPSEHGHFPTDTGWDSDGTQPILA